MFSHGGETIHSTLQAMYGVATKREQHRILRSVGYHARQTSRSMLGWMVCCRKIKQSKEGCRQWHSFFVSNHYILSDTFINHPNGV